MSSKLTRNKRSKKANETVGTFTREEYLKARMRVQDLARRVREDEKATISADISSDRREKETSEPRHISKSSAPELEALENALVDGEKELVKTIRTAVLHRAQEITLIDIVGNLKRVRNLWTKETRREVRNARSDVARRSNEFKRALQELNDKHSEAANKMRSEFTEESAEMKRTYESRQQKERERSEGAMKTAIANRIEEAEVVAREMVTEEVSVVRKEMLAAEEERKKALVVEYKEKLQVAVARMTSGCRKELARVDAQVAKLLRSGSEVKESYAAECETAARLRTAVESSTERSESVEARVIELEGRVRVAREDARMYESLLET